MDIGLGVEATENAGPPVHGLLVNEVREMPAGKEFTHVAAEGFDTGATGGAGHFVFSAAEFVLQIAEASFGSLDEVTLLLLGEHQGRGNDDTRLPGGTGRGRGEFFRDDLALRQWHGGGRRRLRAR